MSLFRHFFEVVLGIAVLLLDPTFRNSLASLDQSLKIDTIRFTSDLVIRFYGNCAAIRKRVLD